MLAYVLALVVGLGSLAFYMAPFFFPEVHRKSDFLWSGVGLFYALVLWVCAGRITGGVLLGQMAGVSLLGWLGWQTLTLRRSLTPPEAKTQISPETEEKLKSFSFTELGQQLLAPVTRLVQKQQTPTTTPQTATVTETAAPKVPEPAQANVKSTPAEAVVATEAVMAGVSEVAEPPTPDTTEAATSETATVEVSEAVEPPTPDTTAQVMAEEVVTPDVTTTEVTETPEPTEEIEYRTPAVTVIDNRPSQTEATPEADTDEAIEVTDTTTAPNTIEEESAKDEAEMSESAEVVPPNPPEPELIEAAQPKAEHQEPLTEIEVEEIAPEATFSPDAEPRGPGDPEMRANLPEPPVAMEVVPIEPESETSEEKPENPPKQS